MLSSVDQVRQNEKGIGACGEVAAQPKLVEPTFRQLPDQMGKVTSREIWTGLP